MAVARTIFLSFVTVRYAAADGSGMGHFLVVSVIKSFATADGNSIHNFLVFLSL